MIALIVILLHFSVTIHVSILNKGVDIKAKYLGFTLYPRKEKKPRTKMRKRSSHPENKADDMPDKSEFGDDFDEEISDYELMHGVDDKAFEHSEKMETEKASDKVVYEKIESRSAEDKKSEISKNKDSRAKKSKAKKDKNKVQTKEKEPSKLKQLRTKYNKIKPYIPSGWKYFKKLLKTIRISIDDVHITVGREDAHEAAIYYGAIQGLIANTLSLLSGMFTVKVRRCDVNCVFTENLIKAKGELTVRVRPSALISVVVCLGVNFLIIWFKQKKITDSENQVSAEAA